MVDKADRMINKTVVAYFSPFERDLHVNNTQEFKFYSAENTLGPHYDGKSFKIKGEDRLVTCLCRQRGESGRVALPMPKLGVGWGWVINAMSRPLCPR